MSMSDQESVDCKINHPYIYIEPYNKKLCKVSLKKSSDEWQDFLDDALDYSKETKSWIIKNEEIKEFKNLLDNINEEKLSKHDSSSSSSSEESDSTDDELIQKTLSRRLKSESKRLLIDEDDVEDSLDEDVISTSRRMRYVLKMLRDLRKRVEHLESVHQK
jgi:hypothetical protein